MVESLVVVQEIRGAGPTGGDRPALVLAQHSRCMLVDCCYRTALGAAAADSLGSMVRSLLPAEMVVEMAAVLAAGFRNWYSFARDDRCRSH